MAETILQIKKLREAAGLTQQELAARAKVRQPTVAQWERGVRNPGLPMLPRIAEALGCTISELFGEDNGPDLYVSNEADIRAVAQAMCDRPRGEGR